MALVGPLEKTMEVGGWMDREGIPRWENDSGSGGGGLDGWMVQLGFHLCINSRWVKLGAIRSLRS